MIRSLQILEFAEIFQVTTRVKGKHSPNISFFKKNEVSICVWETHFSICLCLAENRRTLYELIV